MIRPPPRSTLFPYTTLFRSTANGRLHFHAVHFMRTLPTGSVDPNFGSVRKKRSEERFSRNAETDLVCRLLLEKKKKDDKKGAKKKWITKSYTHTKETEVKQL